MKRIWKLMTLLTLSLFALSMVLTTVSAEPVEKADAFVCPHLGGKAGENGRSPKISPIYGGYTIGGPDVSVPAHATNWGYPNIEHGVPGDVGYTAIWNRANAPEQ
jgi:hypothetical protein